MKDFVIGLGILCLLVGLCQYGEREIAERTHRIAVPLEMTLTAIQSGNAAQAQTYIALAAHVWRENEAALASLINHDHTNRIGENLAQLPRTPVHELGWAVEGLLKQLRDLAEMERVLWKNIL